jgi:hypothetical protein
MSIQIRQKTTEWGAIIYKEKWSVDTVEEYNTVVEVLYEARIPFATTFCQVKDTEHTLIGINHEKWYDDSEKAKRLFDKLFDLKVKHGQLTQPEEPDLGHQY